MIHRLHIYAGLICAVYLLMIGISAMNFQHQFFRENPTDTLNFSRNIDFDPALKIDSLSNFIRLELGIKGHLPPWEFRESDTGYVRFKIERPARTYEVKMNRNSKVIDVDEIHYSFGKILRALHFGSTRNRLGDPLINVWTFYGQISGLSALVAIITGMWFWFNHAVTNRRQWFTIVVSGVVSLIYILYIWIVG